MYCQAFGLLYFYEFKIFYHVNFIKALNASTWFEPERCIFDLVSYLEGWSLLFWQLCYHFLTPVHVSVC